jgi:hypothetical protein
VDVIAQVNLIDLPEAFPAQQPGGAGRHNEARLPVNAPQRCAVEVVPMQMRDQHRVDISIQIM